MKFALWIFLLLLVLLMVGTYSFALISWLISLVRTKWVPYVPSPNIYLNLIKDFVKIKPNSKMVDLGCWDWKALRFFAKNYWTIWDWYEIDIYSTTLGRLINKIFKIKNVNINVANFFKADLSKYDYVYVYLLPDLLANIESRVFENIKDDTIIISSGFEFALHKPFETLKDPKWKDRVYLYKK